MIHRRSILAGLGALAAVGKYSPALAWDATGPLTLPGRWSTDKAQAWYADQGWMVGANYIPRGAINQLEMWQADTFNPNQIDEELGWAAKIGMNTLRVYLHDLAWSQDPGGFLERINLFLNICQSHRIKAMFVIFDDVWNPNPGSGRQPAPKPHLHNSGWVQSPGQAYLGDPKRQDDLQAYVAAVLTRFGSDARVIAWDLYNEPGNLNSNSYGDAGLRQELPEKPKFTAMLLKKVFTWARQLKPQQPLSAGIYWGTAGVTSGIVDVRSLAPRSLADLHPINQFALANSDFISWHNYDHAASFAAEVRIMSHWQRPLILSEYLARGNASALGTNDFSHMLSIAKAFKVGMFNWGLVDGKTQTKYPWSSWEASHTEAPKIWHHDIFRADGTPYDPTEAEFIRSMTQS